MQEGAEGVRISDSEEWQHRCVNEGDRPQGSGFRAFESRISVQVLGCKVSRSAKTITMNSYDRNLQNPTYFIFGYCLPL